MAGVFVLSGYREENHGEAGIKLKHWCGYQVIYARIRPPMLEFAY
ncbi:MAG: hypothetical protein ABI905_17870 [Betaproteobacteria bacterium]